MKKLLTMAAIAAISLGAQAMTTWSLDIRNCDKGTIPSGTVPSTLKVSLYDNNGGYRQIYSQDIDFSKLDGASAYIYDADNGSRFKIVDYVAAKGEQFVKFGDGTLTVINLGDAYGTSAQYSVPVDDRVYKIFPSGLTDEEAEKYAKNYLVAVFEAETGTYELAKSKTLSRSNLYTQGKLEDVAPIGPVPEPTSGLLMLLGMAGLALKRKQKV